MTQVSITWKWLAVTVVSFLLTFIGYDRITSDKRVENFEHRIEKIENTIMVAPTQQDIRDLRASIEKLGDKFDNFKDEIRIVK